MLPAPATRQDVAASGKWQTAGGRQQSAWGRGSSGFGLASTSATATSDCEAKSNRRAHKSQTAAVLLEFTLRLIVNGIMMESHKVAEEKKERERQQREGEKETAERAKERQSGPAKGSSLAKLL